MKRLVLSILIAGGAALLLAACHGGEHHEFLVDTGTDAPDASPGDGVCEATAGVGDCTLRAAVDEANALTAAAPASALVDLDELAETHAVVPPTFTITLAADVTLGRPGAAEDGNATGDLDLRADIAIDGSGFTIDGSELDRVLHVHSGSLNVTQAVITGGSMTEAAVTSSGGGGIRAEAATTVTLVRTTVASNVANVRGGCVRSVAFPGGPCSPAFIAGGGGLWSAGTTTIVQSTFSDNTAIPNFVGCSPAPAQSEVCGAAFGGAVLSAGAGRTTVVESTFSGNAALSTVPTDEGSAIFDEGNGDPVLLSTFVDNVPDPNAPVARATVLGSIMVGTSCADPTIVAGHNLVSALPCPAVPGGDPGVGPLADNGGPTQTHLPEASSAAIDAIPLGTEYLCAPDFPDQRGAPRPAGSACDIGAVERQADDP